MSLTDNNPETTETDETTETRTTTHVNDGADLEIAEPEDFGVVRNDDGDLETVDQKIPGSGEFFPDGEPRAIRCKPMVDGAGDKWEDVTEGESPDPDRVDDFFKEFIQEGIGAKGRKNVGYYLEPALIEAVKRSSGQVVFQALQETEMAAEMAALEEMENLPDGLLETAMDAVNNDRQQNDSDESTNS